MPTPAEGGFRHGGNPMPKLRVGMPPTILAIMPQMAKMLQKIAKFLFFLLETFDNFV